MLINEVELENVKSYRHESISFTPGKNAISGQNGAGKSTILEAIGYALFDFEPIRPIEKFVREGESRGRVRVTITAKDERSYIIVRGIDSNEYYVADTESGRKLAEQKKSVLPWIYENLGVSQSINLSDLFEHTIGVPQGKLVAPFLDTPNYRKRAFDPVLRTEEYREAAESKTVREAARGLELEKVDSESRLRELEQKEIDYKKMKEEASKISSETEAAEAWLVGARPRLESLKTEKAKYEKAELGINSARTAAAQLKPLLGDPSAVYAEIAQIDERLRGYDELSRIVEKIPDLEKQKESVRGSIATLESRIEEWQRSLTELQGAEAVCPVCDTPLPEDKKTSVAEKKSGYISHAEQEIRGYRETETRINAELQAAREADKKARQLETLKAKRGPLEEKAKQLESLKTQYREAEARLVELMKSYDPESVRKTKAEYDDLMREIGVKEGELSKTKARAEQLRTQIVEAENALAARPKYQASLAEIEAAGSLLSDVQDTLKKAGPLVTEAYLQKINFEAASLYRELTGNPAAELVWDREYEVRVREGGAERIMKQLSGGQQTAAAIAIRFSLLKNMSDLDILFLDEPTHNLDAVRRENLAWALSKLTGFSQLFIISHDDTFDKNVENVVHIDLVDGESRVMS